MNCHHCGKEAYEVGVIINGMPLCADCNDKRLAKIEMAQAQIECAQCGENIKGKAYERTSDGGVSWPLCLDCAIEWDQKRGKKTDVIEHPAHYTQGSIECIEALEAALTPEEFRGHCKACAIKYAWREKHKGGDESLEKAVWYLRRAIDASKRQA